MKLTKEDYMCLPKERLAELLVERDAEDALKQIPAPVPYVPAYPSNPPIPWWRDVIYAFVNDTAEAYQNAHQY